MADQQRHRHLHRIQSSALSPAQVPRLGAKLASLMPYSLPLFRRIQFHLSRPVSETARVFVAIATDEGDGDEGTDAQGAVVGNETKDQDDVRVIDDWLSSPLESTSSWPWIAAHIDLAYYGQTQAWVYASWEFRETTNTASAVTGTADVGKDGQTPPTPHLTRDLTKEEDRVDDTDPLHQALVISLFRYIHHDLVPTMPEEPDAEWNELLRTGKIVTVPYSREKVLFGTINTRLLSWIPERARTRIDAGYFKYVFAIDQNEHQRGDGGDQQHNEAPSNPLDRTSGKYSSLPPGYTFGPMQSAHLQTVLDRSVIPRTLTTMKQLESLAVFYRPTTRKFEAKETQEPESSDAQPSSEHPQEPTPVAWGFLGKDASFSSLHTEPEHRGKGLAGCLARELLRRSAWGSSVMGSAEARQEESTTGSKTGKQQEERTSLLPEAPEAPEAATWNLNWGHSDVSAANKPSRRVMEKLGGVPLWRVAWVEVDVGVALDVLESNDDDHVPNGT